MIFTLKLMPKFHDNTKDLEKNYISIDSLKELF